MRLSDNFSMLLKIACDFKRFIPLIAVILIFYRRYFVELSVIVQFVVVQFLFVFCRRYFVELSVILQFVPNQ